MKIVNIEWVVPEHLLAVQFEGNESNEYDRLFEQWEDPEYLSNFFRENAADLITPFYNYCSIDMAIKRTIEESAAFDEKILKAAQTSKTFTESIGNIFKPLIMFKSGSRQWEESKAYGPQSHSWLRIYAVRASLDVYVVSGGAIKLTRKMDERDHTRTELEKLKIVARFLRRSGFETSDDFVYLDFD